MDVHFSALGCFIIITNLTLNVSITVLLSSNMDKSNLFTTVIDLKIWKHLTQLYLV